MTEEMQMQPGVHHLDPVHLARFDELSIHEHAAALRSHGLRRRCDAYDAVLCGRLLNRSHDPETRHDPLCNYFKGKAPHIHDESCFRNPLCQPLHDPAWAAPVRARTAHRVK
jgi:hypothetical protein